MANREELLIIRAARAGQGPAQLALGKRYLFGSASLPQSHTTALHWLEKAAEQNQQDAWMLIGEDAGPHFFTIVRAVAGYLQAAPWRRIEAAVASDFRQGHRLIKMLGFEFEGRMRAFSPDGVDHDLYARVK